MIKFIPLFLLSIALHANVSIAPISDSISIKVTEFNGTVTNKALDELKKYPTETANTLLIDLRSNAGGNLYDAISFGSLFVTQNNLIQLINKDNSLLQVTRPSNHPHLLFKSIIVLINQETASAAEAAATILKHHPNHLVIGKTTHGKTNIMSQNKNTSYIAMNISKVKPDIEHQWLPNQREKNYLHALAIKNTKQKNH